MFGVCESFEGRIKCGKERRARIAGGGGRGGEGEGGKGRDVCCDKRQTTANRGEKDWSQRATR